MGTSYNETKEDLKINLQTCINFDMKEKELEEVKNCSEKLNYNCNKEFLSKILLEENIILDSYRTHHC